MKLKQATQLLTDINAERWNGIDVRVAALICHFVENLLVLLYEFGVDIQGAYEICEDIEIEMIRSLNKSKNVQTIANAQTNEKKRKRDFDKLLGIK